VQTNSYNAEYGDLRGHHQRVTKSGTNQFHGSLFEFWRNNALNAHDWNNPSNSPLRRDQFGRNGGRTDSKKTRRSSFFLYGGLRQSRALSLNGAVVPTAAERNGDFSQTPERTS